MPSEPQIIELVQGSLSDEDGHARCAALPILPESLTAAKEEPTPLMLELVQGVLQDLSPDTVSPLQMELVQVGKLGDGDVSLTASLTIRRAADLPRPPEATCEAEDSLCACLDAHAGAHQSAVEALDVDLRQEIARQFDGISHCECSAEEQRCNALGAETPVEAAVVIAEESEPAVDLLRSPTVWQTHRDEATGVVFYWNTVELRSQSEAPAEGSTWVSASATALLFKCADVWSAITS